MSIGGWMRVLDTIGGLAQVSNRARGAPGADDAADPAGGGVLGQLEARLAGVAVAALKEAFDRDRARLDLERSQMEAEQHRAEVALRAEIRRQAVERSLSQLRLIAVLAAAVWILSAALGVSLPNMRAPLPLVLMGAGWACAIAALGCALGASQHVASPSADVPVQYGSTDRDPPGTDIGRIGTVEYPGARAARAALVLLLAALALSGASLLFAVSGALSSHPAGEAELRGSEARPR